MVSAWKNVLYAIHTGDNVGVTLLAAVILSIPL